LNIYDMIASDELLSVFDM